MTRPPLTSSRPVIDRTTTPAAVVPVTATGYDRHVAAADTLTDVLYALATHHATQHRVPLAAVLLGSWYTDIAIWYATLDEDTRNAACGPHPAPDPAVLTAFVTADAHISRAVTDAVTGWVRQRGVTDDVTVVHFGHAGARFVYRGTRYRVDRDWLDCWWATSAPAPA